MGQLALPNAARVYVDTVTVIYGIEQASVYGILLDDLWHNLMTGNLLVFTSKLTLMETLIIPIRNLDTFLIDAYERLLRSPQMQLLPIQQSVLREAARLRAIVPSLRTPDAIHAATAIISGCTQFLTNARQLRRVTGLPVVSLNEVLAS